MDNKYKINAIYELYPTVKHIEITSEGTIIAKNENSNDVSIDMSAVNTKATELQAEADAKKQADATNKASGNQKLLDLGLTQAEATALTGYTPPVAE